MFVADEGGLEARRQALVAGAEPRDSRYEARKKPIVREQAHSRMGAPRIRRDVRCTPT